MFGRVFLSEKYKATYSIHWFQNQRIKIQEKEGRQKESKKKEFFGLGKVERVELLLFFFHWRGHQLMVNMSQRSIECHSSIMSI